MIPVHSMIFWSRPKKLNIDEMTEICFKILNELNHYSDELAPLYLPARKKSEVVKFELNIKNIKDLLEKNINREGEVTFEDLGRRISFFSSLSEELSCGININIGVSNARFKNTMVINLPYGDFSGLAKRKDDFKSLFKKIVQLFNPYFAFVSNSLNKHISNEFWKDDKPTYAHWLNFYDKTVAEKIGLDKLSTLHGSKVLNNCGYYFELQEGSIDVNNPEHLKKQRELTKQLGL